MDFHIFPVTGCRELPFGLARSQVRSVIPGRVDSPFRTSEEDGFLDTGLFALFDKNERLNAVEFFEPAQVFLGDQQLLGMPFGEAKRLLAAVGGDVEEEDAGASCANIGIGLYVPAARDYPDDPVETVIVFKEGYYDQT
ncbi:MAG: hypothetical protein JSR86_20830 [Proteobacteria bacterium]|nr:hypothetical protein [Pseudomonadota bacterium]